MPKKTSQSGHKVSVGTPSFERLLPPLHQIANCLGLQSLESPIIKGKTDTDKILFLSSLGFDRNAIAAIIGTTPATVSVRQSEAKAAQQGKGGNK